MGNGSRVFAYLRASTADQDATRAKTMLDTFCCEQGASISGYFVENASGATLDRPELMRALAFMQEGDVLLLEQVDRLTRLKSAEWEKLRAIIEGKGIRLCALDLPFTFPVLEKKDSVAEDDFQQRIMAAITGMMLDVLAAVARKDFDDRRRRQKEGIAKAKEQGKYAGRKKDEQKRNQILALRERGLSYSEIEEILGCSRRTIAKAVKGA